MATPHLHLPGDPKPLANLASTRPGPVRELTRTLTRIYGHGLIVTTHPHHTTWTRPTKKTPTR